jgi:DNA-binding response OmpR family regulator
MSEIFEAGSDFSSEFTTQASNPTDSLVSTGIEPLDDRVGGLAAGGSYLLVGPPGPEKMVAALQFLHAGVLHGDPVLLLTNAAPEDILDVARAWGFDLGDAWRSGSCRIVGFRDDFELRALRSIEPEEVLEELDGLAPQGLSRIAVDPASMFLTGGAKTLLGAAFLRWTRKHPATVCATFSVDGVGGGLPSAADWMVNASTGRLMFERRSQGLHQVTLTESTPNDGRREETVSVQLKPGVGLVTPDSYPSRRRADRPGLDTNRLLLVSLGGTHATDLGTWAASAFETDVVVEPFEAVTKVQSEIQFGGILVHAPRHRIREAVQACRAIRPLTDAAVVFASDDAVRSTDRVHILEAGADDCLSGGVDFNELGLRIKQAMAHGPRPPADAESVDARSAEAEAKSSPQDSDGGIVSKQVLAAEVVRRGTNSSSAFFCVLRITSGELSPPELQGLLAEQIRDDEGDLVAADADLSLVLLQGAREGQTRPFLTRLRSRLDEGGQSSNLDVAVLSHPSETEAIHELLGVSGADGG